MQSGHTKVDTSLDFVRFLFRDVVVSRRSTLNSTSTPATSTYLESVQGCIRGRELPRSVLGNLSSFSSDNLIVSG
jgi:glutaredoxin 2